MLAAGAHQRFVAMGHAKWTARIQLMEEPEKEFGGQGVGLTLEVFEVRLELWVEILVVKLVGLHYMTVSVNYFVLVEHFLVLPSPGSRLSDRLPADL
jgi:hypothetical protein